MAGLKHMDVLQGRADQVCGEIQRMAPDEVEKTYDFISSVITARRGAQRVAGSPEKLLEHQGKWTFNEGERVRLLEELARMRRGERK